MAKRTDSISAQAEAAAVGEMLAPAFLAILGDDALPDDPAELEQLITTLLVPLEQSDVPAEVSLVLLDQLERQASVGAATLLEGFALLAGDPVAAQARAAVDRLAGAGFVSPVTGRIGNLTVRKAMRAQSADGELLVAELRRTGSRKTQLALIGIDRGETGGALASCLLTPAMSAARVRRLMEGDETAGGLSSCEPIAIAELVEGVRAAAQRAVDISLAIDADSAVALPLIARALTGDPHGLARPDAIAPWEDDDPELVVDAAEDEDGFHALIDLLLEEFEEHVMAQIEASSPVWQSGDFVASCMLEWKGGYGDGRLGHWTEDDLEELLLDYFPRKVTATQETLDVVPECVIAFLGFLDARGSLSGRPLEQLELACGELAEPFLEYANDPGNWGLAKSMAMQMLAEGIDAEDPGAVGAWLEDFNARPRDERDAIVGGAADRMLEAAARRPGSASGSGSGSGSARSSAKGGGSRSPKRDRQRKAQRTARKGNRPRR